MFIISFLSGKYCLTLVTIQKIQSFLMRVIKIVIGKMKGESGGRIIDEFVGLKPKMYSMLSDDGKESNTAKGVNIATEFNGFRETLFNKKVVNEKN